MSYYYMDPNNQIFFVDSYADPNNFYPSNPPNAGPSLPVQNPSFLYPNPHSVNSDYYRYPQNPLPLQFYPSQPLPESQRTQVVANYTFGSSPPAETVMRVVTNQKKYRGETPLHGAVSNDNLEKVEKLIEEGADVHAITFRGKTPLSYAMNNYKRNLDGKKFKMIEILVAAGGFSKSIVDTTLKNHLEREIFILKYSVYVPHSGNIDILIKAGANKQAMKDLVMERYKNCAKEKMDSVKFYFEESLKKLDVPSNIILEMRSNETLESKLQESVPKVTIKATVNSNTTSHNASLLATQKANKLEKSGFNQS